MTLELALLAFEPGSEEHLLLAVVAGGNHVEFLGEAVRDVVGHAAPHSGRARRARRTRAVARRAARRTRVILRQLLF